MVAVSGNVLLPGCREREWSPGDDFERVGGLWLPPAAVDEDRGDQEDVVVEPGPLAIDLFAGCGGFSLGFHQAGFHVIAASEAWHCAVLTYLLNLGSPETTIHVLDAIEGEDTTVKDRRFHELHAGGSVTAAEFFDYHHRNACKDAEGEALPPGGGWIAGQPDALPVEHIYLGDVRGLTGKRILEDLGLPGEAIGCVFGGPPCQGFSLAGKQQVEDPRNSLVFEFMRLVIEINPQAFVMENVPNIVNMVTPEGINVVDALSRIAEAGSFGTFDGIKRALLQTSGAGAVMRSDGKPSRGKHVRPDDDAEDEPLDDPQLAMEMA